MRGFRAGRSAEGAGSETAVGSFDRRKCKGPLNGLEGTGGHCPEGWTLYQYRGLALPASATTAPRRAITPGSISTIRCDSANDVLFDERRAPAIPTACRLAAARPRRARCDLAPRLLRRPQTPSSIRGAASPAIGLFEVASSKGDRRLRKKLPLAPAENPGNPPAFADQRGEFLPPLKKRASGLSLPGEHARAYSLEGE